MSWCSSASTGERKDVRPKPHLPSEGSSSMLSLNVLRFGDEVKLHTRSVFKRDAVTKEWPEDYSGGYIGVYEKKHRASRVVVPPLGKAKGEFIESVFRVEDPKEHFPGGSHGKPVRYADWVVLIDQSGYVWNNKSGGYFDGYVGPRPRGANGEMYLSFHKVGMEHKAVEYLHSVYIDVEHSHRYRVGFNQRLGNYKTASSKVEGGYIVSDGYGEPLEVSIHRAEPDDVGPDAAGQPDASLLCVGVVRKPCTLARLFPDNRQEDVMMMYPKYGSGITLYGVRADDEVRIHLSNSGVAKFLGKELEHGHGREIVIEGEVTRSPAEAATTNEADTSNLGRLKVGWKRASERKGDFVTDPSGATETDGNVLPKTPAEAVVPLLKAFVLFTIVYLAASFVLDVAGFKPRWSSLWVAWLLGLLTPPASRTSIAEAATVAGKCNDSEDVSKDYVLTVALGGDPRHHSSLERQFSQSRLMSQKNIVKGKWEIPGRDDEGTPKHPAFKRFLDGEQGNREVALKRWEITTEWRRDGNVDNILTRPHRNFKVIKDNYPHFFFRRGKKGHPIYIEKPGGVSMTNLRKAGVKLKDLLWHYLFITEYLWSRLEPSETAMTITILDLKGIGMYDFAGEVVDFVKKASAFVQEHYPERSYQIFIVNVPIWFKMIWNMAKGFANERTIAKMHIHKNKKDATQVPLVRRELLEHIDAEDLPIEYGGTCAQALEDSPEEILLQNLVYEGLKREEAQMIGPDSRPIEGTPASLTIDNQYDPHDIWDCYESRNGIPSTTGKITREESDSANNDGDITIDKVGAADEEGAMNSETEYTR